MALSADDQRGVPMANLGNVETLDWIAQSVAESQRLARQARHDDRAEMRTTDPADALHAPLRIANALERIADALEAQAAAQGMTAEFFRSASEPTDHDAEQPQQGIRDFEDYRESETLNHFLVTIGGTSVDATPAEDAAIRERISQRRGR